MLANDTSQEEEIYVPPQLVRVLKEYTKAVVRAKPADLLLWSAVYFRNLASGQSPERKERLHIFDPAAGGLSQDIIRLMYLKLKEKETVVVGDLKSLWNDLKLDSYLLLELFRKAGVPEDDESKVNWIEMLALATAVISENLKDTMRKFLEVVGDTTSEPGMPLPEVEEIFRFLAEVDSIPSSNVENALQYLRETGAKQDGFISSSDFQDAFPDIG